MNYSAKICNYVQYGVRYECYVVLEFVMMRSIVCSMNAI